MAPTESKVSLMHHISSYFKLYVFGSDIIIKLCYEWKYHPVIEQIRIMSFQANPWHVLNFVYQIYIVV